MTNTGKSESMVDRVARAMESKRRELIAQPLSRIWGELAIAGIEAMRDPTEAMRDSCGNGECAIWAPGAWANYIDAALKE
jgi:hypothetical protein